jgi:hypothetical protein
MTLDEARKVGEIVSNADGGCPVCVEHLCEDLNRDFPAFRWTRVTEGEGFGKVDVEEVRASP